MLKRTILSEISRREGYAAGDRALQELAHAVERGLDGATAIAGRFSGRRLAIVLPAAGHHAAADVAARAVESFDGTGPVLRTGIAVWQHGGHGEDVLARARVAAASATALA